MHLKAVKTRSRPVRPSLLRYTRVSLVVSLALFGTISGTWLGHWFLMVLDLTRSNGATVCLSVLTHTHFDV